MTAISATSATESRETANPFPDLASAGAVLRTVLLPGSPATYANRAALREMGLRWDPGRHQWHGMTTADRAKVLREQLGLEVRCFVSLDPPPRGPSPPRPTAPILPSVRDHAPRPHDGSRTHAEARTVYGGGEDASTNSRFSERDITSGLPDDSREADELEEARRLRDLRGRVKAARALVATTPGFGDALQRDWQKAARFYASFGISETRFRRGVPPELAAENELPSANPPPQGGTSERLGGGDE